MVYELTNVSTLDAGAVRRCAATLPSFRTAKASRLRLEDDRRCSVLAWAVLQHALETEFGIVAKEDDLTYNRFGKPLMRDRPQTHFNISHTKDAVACVVDHRAVGCDAQSIAEIPEPDEALARRVLHPQEQAVLASVGPGMRRRVFGLFWVLKEAWSKRLGVGLFVDVSRKDFSGIVEERLLDPSRSTYCDGFHRFMLDEVDGTAFCACMSKRAPGLHLVRLDARFVADFGQAPQERRQTHPAVPESSGL